MLLEINSTNPDKRKIDRVVECLKDGGLIVFPTDTVYALGCDIKSNSAFEIVCRLKGVKTDKANFSFIMNDLSHISNYTKPFDRAVFKLLNKALPGAYTFILNANSEVPSIFRSKKKTIGIRVPDNKIAYSIVELLGNPVMATSLHSDQDNFLEYPISAYEIFERYANDVDIVIDGGDGHIVPSTIIDCTGDEPVLIRQGAGDSSILD